MSQTPPANQHCTKPFWKSLFSEGGFDWSFQMRLGDAASYFAPHHGGSLLAEKRAWLDARPELFTAVARHGEELIAATWDQALAWGHVSPPADGKRDLSNLARQWEPDILLLDHETMSFAAACVCFSSSWSPAHTVGKSLDEVHAMVPQLNPRIGEKIARFLRQLQPGKAYRRENWGFTRTAEMNYHPELHRQRLDETVTIGELHLRVEQQLFTGIPGGVLMGIRIETCPLAELSTDPVAWQAVAEKIRTMPDDVAAYKGMGTARAAMLEEMQKLTSDAG
jgi:hypothetical protein